MTSGDLNKHTVSRLVMDAEEVSATCRLSSFNATFSDHGGNRTNKNLPFRSTDTEDAASLKFICIQNEKPDCWKSFCSASLEYKGLFYINPSICISFILLHFPGSIHIIPSVPDTK